MTTVTYNVAELIRRRCGSSYSFGDAKGQPRPRAFARKIGGNGPFLASALEDHVRTSSKLLAAPSGDLGSVLRRIVEVQSLGAVSGGDAFSVTCQDVSHSDSERELVLWSGFGVETREFGDELNAWPPSAIQRQSISSRSVVCGLLPRSASCSRELLIRLASFFPGPFKRAIIYTWTFLGHFSEFEVG